MQNLCKGFQGFTEPANSGDASPGQESRRLSVQKAVLQLYKIGYMSFRQGVSVTCTQPAVCCDALSQCQVRTMMFVLVMNRCVHMEVP